MKDELKRALAEDISRGDVTSNLLIPKNAAGSAVIISREPGIFFGVEVARELFRIADPKLRARFFIQDGKNFPKNKKLIEIRGRVRSILKTERTVLNFLQHLSGISTQTRRFVEKVKKYRVKILDTRKTTPLWRELEKAAVKAGGGFNHRFSLADEIFVKENHRIRGYKGQRSLIGLRGSKSKIVLKPLQLLKPFEPLRPFLRYPRRFIIEVRNLRELKEIAGKIKPRVILFDNFSPVQLKRAVAYARKKDPRAILEASGGITLENVTRFAATGVDQISIGSLTHSVKSIDLSLLAERT